MSPWEAAAPVIRRRLFKNNDAYLVIDRHGLGSTWLEGGCWVAAEAIRRVFGGDLVAVHSRWGLEHVVVERGGWLVDAEGHAAPTARWVRRYARREGIVDASLHPFSGVDARVRGVLFDESAVRQTVELLQ